MNTEKRLDFQKKKSSESSIKASVKSQLTNAGLELRKVYSFQSDVNELCYFVVISEDAKDRAGYEHRHNCCWAYVAIVSPTRGTRSQYGPLHLPHYRKVYASKVSEVSGVDVIKLKLKGILPGDLDVKR